jgi:hypothetical protein
MAERIWFEDIQGFMVETNFYVIWPTKDMPFAQQLNALVRFSIYFALIVFVLKHDINIFFVVVVMAAFTYFIYTNDKTVKQTRHDIIEKMNEMDVNGRRCVRPSAQNPFMNVLMTDYAKNPQRPPACETSQRTKRDIKANFDRNLYRDVDDIFHKKASDRQFYTTPITTIPNDQTKFAKWLYGTPATCKEGNGEKCYRNMSRGINV